MRDVVATVFARIFAIAGPVDLARIDIVQALPAEGRIARRFGSTGIDVGLRVRGVLLSARMANSMPGGFGPSGPVTAARPVPAPPAPA